MITKEAVTLSRDCEGIQLSSSRKVTLAAGSQVTVTQSSPESITVKTAPGELVRVAASDADALNGSGQAAPAGAMGLITALNRYSPREDKDTPAETRVGGKTKKK